MTIPVTVGRGVRVDAENAEQAKRYLDGRMRRRLDGVAVGWTVQDAHMVRRLLSYVRELEQKVKL